MAAAWPYDFGSYLEYYDASQGLSEHPQILQPCDAWGVDPNSVTQHRPVSEKNFCITCENGDSKDVLYLQSLDGIDVQIKPYLITLFERSNRLQSTEASKTDLDFPLSNTT